MATDDKTELADLRDDIRQLAEAQTADRAQLNGRIGAIDREQRVLAKEMAKNSALTQVTATKVVALEAGVFSIDSNVKQLLAREDKAANAKQRLQTEEVKLRRAKWVTVGKVVATVIGSGAFGLLVAKLLTGCG